MLKLNIKRLFAVTAATIALLGSSLVVAPAVFAGPFDASKDAACSGVQLQDSASCGSIGGAPKLHSTLKLVINILSFIAGFAAVVMIIVSGLRYITSGGDAGKVSGAKEGLIYAVVGLVVVMVAQFIVRFVLSKTP